MLLIFALALVSLLQQDNDEATRARIRAIVLRLDGDKVEDRTRAIADLQKVNVRYAPYIAELGSTLSPQAAGLLRGIAVTAPWPEFLRGSISESRTLIAGIYSDEVGRHSAVVADVLKALAFRPSADIQRILSQFWSASHDRLRALAVAGWGRWPPIDLEPLRPLLSDPTHGEQVASILILAGDDEGIPAAVDAYVARRREGSRAAMRVLARSGVSDSDLGRVMGVWKDGFVPESEDFWIVGRRTSDEGARKLAEWIKSSSPGCEHAVPVLAWTGNESQMVAVRTWAADHVKEKYVPWPLYDPGAALRRFEKLGVDPPRQELFELGWWAWQAGPALRGPILERLKRPDLKLNARRQFLRMLGWAGASEDAAILLEALADPRLAEAAGDALDMMGDPAHAKALFQAFMRIGDTKQLGPAVMSMPADSLEDLLAEVIADADSYPNQATSAVLLAGRNLTPRLRDALIESYSPGLGIGPAVEAVLLDSRNIRDAGLIARLKASKHEGLRGVGHHLAMRAGDETAAPVAAVGARGRTNSMRYDLGRVWLDSGESAGDVWKDALEADWKKVVNKPGEPWLMGVWLAERGVPEAVQFVRERLGGQPSMTTAFEARALALSGTPEDVTKAVELFLDPRLQLERYGEDMPRLDPSIGAKLDEAHRFRIVSRAREEAPHKPSGNPFRRVVVVSAQLGLPEARALHRHVAGHAHVNTGNQAEQVECLRSLARHKDERSLPLFRMQLRSQTPAVRAASIDALAALGDRAGAVRIARYVDDPAQVSSITDQYEFGAYTVRPIRRVWHHAMEALERITGENPPAGSVLQRREFWRAWAAKQIPR